MGKTMGDMRRADEIRDLTPEQIKVNACFGSQMIIKLRATGEKNSTNVFMIHTWN